MYSDRVMRKFLPSDIQLDWPGVSHSAVRSYRDLTYRDSEADWQFGHRQKLRQLTANFAKTTTMHGVRFICGRSKKVPRWKLIFFRLLFACCVLAMCGSCFSLIDQSFRAESIFVSTTNKEMSLGRDEDPYFPEFPRLVLCRRPGYRIASESNNSQKTLVEYAYLALGYPFSPLSPLEVSLMVGIKKYELEGVPLTPELKAFSQILEGLNGDYQDKKQRTPEFNLTEFILENSVSCEEIFVNCFLLVFPFNCCQAFQPMLTNLGICYSLTHNRSSLEFFESVKDLGSSLIFDLRAVPKLDRAVESGYELHLIDPRDESSNVGYEAYALMNGYTTTVRSRLIKTSRTALYTPWHALSDKCPTVPPSLDPENYGKRFLRSECDKIFMHIMTRDNCRCQQVGDESDLSMRRCDPEDIYGCFVHLAVASNLSHMTEICVHPCIEYSYKSEVNFVKIGDESISRLGFQFDGSQYVLEEYRTTTLSGFLSQIGGALGLYVGASIITAVEIISFLILYIYYRCVPHKKSSSNTNQRRNNKRDYFS